MRVNCGVAVARKVLCRGQHPAGPRAANIGRHQIAYLLRVSAECACPDDRVGRVRIHVGDGKEVPVHAKSAAFLRSNATELLRVSRLPGRAKSHGVRKDGGSKEIRRKNASLEITGNQEGQFRLFLELVE